MRINRRVKQKNVSKTARRDCNVDNRSGGAQSGSKKVRTFYVKYIGLYFCCVHDIQYTFILPLEEILI